MYGRHHAGKQPAFEKPKATDDTKAQVAKVVGRKTAALVNARKSEAGERGSRFEKDVDWGRSRGKRRT